MCYPEEMWLLYAMNTFSLGFYSHIHINLNQICLTHKNKQMWHARMNLTYSCMPVWHAWASITKFECLNIVFTDQSLIMLIKALFISVSMSQRFGWIDIQRKVWNHSHLVSNIIICTPKMNKRYMGLKWHEAEKVIADFCFKQICISDSHFLGLSFIRPFSVP